MGNRQSAAKYAEKASELAEMAAHISSSRAIVRVDGSIVEGSDGNPEVYEPAAFQSLALAVSELARAIEQLARE